MIQVTEQSHKEKLFKEWKYMDLDQFILLLSPLEDLSYDSFVESDLEDILIEELHFFKKMCLIIKFNYTITEKVTKAEVLPKNSRLPQYLKEWGEKYHILDVITEYLREYIKNLNKTFL